MTRPYFITTAKSVYGERRLYPACPTANLLLELTGAKTFTLRAMLAIDKLGYLQLDSDLVNAFGLDACLERANEMMDDAQRRRNA